jgi:hypothetical protein
MKADGRDLGFGSTKDVTEPGEIGRDGDQDPSSELSRKRINE